jgi:uncharacterized protein (TIGR00369 family)
VSDPSATAPAIPPGFEYVPRAPFINHVGPILQAIDNPPGHMRLGLNVADVHTNTMGLMHGGMAATLADSAMARSTHAQLRRRTVTLKMTMEYLDPVRLGEFLVIDARVAASDADFAHTACEMSVDGKLRVKASAVFRLLKAM